MKKHKIFSSACTALLVLPIAGAFTYAPLVSAQPYNVPESSVQAQASFAQQELDQMLAPIALYPDSLLSQILMAATYPREVVQAARWSRANPGLYGDQAVQTAAQEDWDPSVKSLVAFPQILAMMDAKLDWTERLGDAFLAQEPQVMDTVQDLRQRAYAAGNFRSDDRIRVVPQGEAIVVESMNPEMVYVPYYDPMVVYGGWWWPSPPVYWSPWYGYYAPRPGFYLSWGRGIPVASGFFFGAFDWPRRYTRVAYANNYYYNRTAGVNRQRDNTFVRNANVASSAWRHDPTHRRGAQYRDPGVRARFTAENSQTPQMTTRTVRPPESRTLDSGRSVVGEPRIRIDERKADDNRRATQQRAPIEYRGDERRRQEAVTRTESQTESRVDAGRGNSGRLENGAGNRAESGREARREFRTNDRREAPAQAERPRAPEVRREAPSASRGQLPAPQARVEQQQARRAATPVAPPRAESVVRAAPIPQPRVEAPRSSMPPQASSVKRDQESRASGNGGRRSARESG